MTFHNFHDEGEKKSWEKCCYLNFCWSAIPKMWGKLASHFKFAPKVILISRSPLPLLCNYQHKCEVDWKCLLLKKMYYACGNGSRRCERIKFNKMEENGNEKTPSSTVLFSFEWLMTFWFSFTHTKIHMNFIFFFHTCGKS